VSVLKITSLGGRGDVSLSAASISFTSQISSASLVTSGLSNSSFFKRDRNRLYLTEDTTLSFGSGSRSFADMFFLKQHQGLIFRK
jgi:hypothetical protein